MLTYLAIFSNSSARSKLPHCYDEDVMVMNSKSIDISSSGSTQPLNQFRIHLLWIYPQKFMQSSSIPAVETPIFRHGRGSRSSFQLCDKIIRTPF